MRMNTSIPCRLISRLCDRRLKLACKVKLNIRVVLPLGIQEPLALRQVNKVAVLVLHNVGLLKARKVFNLVFVARYPAGFIEGKRHEGTACPIFL